MLQAVVLFVFRSSSCVQHAADCCVTQAGVRSRKAVGFVNKVCEVRTILD